VQGGKGKIRGMCSFCKVAKVKKTSGTVTRVGNFRQKNYSAEDGIDGTIGLFRRNSGCSAEQETLGIMFRTIPHRRKVLRILYRGTKI
jgi:hypothetical protein